jgi:hypothetical protein
VRAPLPPVTRCAGGGGRYEDIKDGLTIFRIIDVVAPGVVDWKRVNTKNLNKWARGRVVAVACVRVRVCCLFVCWCVCWYLCVLVCVYLCVRVCILSLVCQCA